MATMNLMKAAVVAVVFAGSTGAAFAAGPVSETVPVGNETASVGATNEATPEPGLVDGSGQDSGVQAYCYWETYCNVYGYCWTNWVCF